VQAQKPHLVGDQLLSMREVAQRLNVPLYTVRLWGREHVFPSIVIRGHRYVRAITLRLWLKKHEHGG
jgi:DNA-binding transcriptional MerR regulator